MPEPSPARELSDLTRQLTRDIISQRKVEALSHEIRQAQAELVAYVVSRGLGLEPHSLADDSMALNGDKKALARSLTVVHETSAQILNELLPEDRVPTGPEAASVRQAFPLNEESFGRIHSQYGNRLVQSITRLVRDRDKAEDIAARAFQLAWAKRDAFRGEASPYTWIQAIARNEARQYWTREQIASIDSIDHAESRELVAPGLVTDALERQDDRFRLQKALEQLPINYRRALTSHLVEGLSIREIASRERIPTGTVLSRIFTGKQLLRDAWEAPPAGPHAGAMARGTPPKTQDRQSPQATEPGGYQARSTESPEPLTWDR